MDNVVVQLSAMNIIVSKLMIQQVLSQPLALLCLAQGLIALFVMNEQRYQEKVNSLLHVIKR